ncbi:MAG: sodium:proton antiporter NhaD [Verrucomicrobia bacterium]|nr:sodium:proton antiporter NhaD [Verrucomicrobiota bacterium]
MESFDFGSLWIVLVFALGYIAIILEHYINVNKTAVALLIAVCLWTIYVGCSALPMRQDLETLGHHVSEIAQILFFLIGAMTLVELVDSHRGFKYITDRIRTRSRRQMLWVIAFVAFFLSAVLDNLTTTILMVSLLRKMIPKREDRFFYCCIIVVAANAGGAWTPIGDVTTTMLWIHGQLSSFAVMKSLFLPSVVSILIPLAWYSMRSKGRLELTVDKKGEKGFEPGGKVVFCLGVIGLISVPIFKGLTGLPPFMGVILALAVLWVVTDVMHFKYAGREHLRVPHVLTRVDTSGILFFLGILLCVASLQSAGILQSIATWLNETVKSEAMIATLIGAISAIIDNVPLVAAAMGMYPIEMYPMDASFWHMIAYAAGTGGSMLIIGSSSGVALMGMEKIDFVTYMRHATVPVAIGYLGGMGVYLLFQRL